MLCLASTLEHSVPVHVLILELANALIVLLRHHPKVLNI